MNSLVKQKLRHISFFQKILTRIYKHIGSQKKYERGQKKEIENKSGN